MNPRPMLANAIPSHLPAGYAEASPEGAQVAVAVDGVPGQVEPREAGGAPGEGLQDAELVVAEVQVDQLGGLVQGRVGQVLQEHVVQE